VLNGVGIEGFVAPTVNALVDLFVGGQTHQRELDRAGPIQVAHGRLLDGGMDGSERVPA
jgi:hypothetical protein